MVRKHRDSRKKTVLILTNTLSHGGAQRVAVRLANALSLQHNVYIMPFDKEIAYPLSERVRFLDAETAMQLRLHWGAIGPFVLKIKRFLFFSFSRLRIRPDATISFLNKADQLNLFTLGGGKKILSERNNPKQKGEDYFRNAERKFRLADCVVFQSQTVKDMFPEDIREKGVVIPNPVEVSCKAAPSSHRIVTAGRLHPQKNHILLIRAFSTFLKGHPEYTLHIYGEGDEYGKLQRFIAEKSLEGKVYLEGFRKDLHREICDAEMFVLSSDFEGMPNALLEAMMMGLPCITTAFEGSEEFFGGSDACLITPVGNETALASAMAELADDEDLRNHLASRASEFSGKYTMEKVVSQWERIL